MLELIPLTLSTGLSTVALVVSVLAWRHARRLEQWQSWPLEEVTKLQGEVDEALVQLAQHHDRLRKMNARLAARERRERPADELPDKTTADPSTGFARQPGESELDWKRRMRTAIASGALKHG